MLSELRKGSACHPRVAAWFSDVDEDDVAISVLVIGEIRRGIETIRRRDAGRSAELERWLGVLITDHGERILPVDRRVADEWGRLTAGRSGAGVDTLMAATARVHGLTLVTRNVRDVDWTGVSYLNPFQA